MEYELVGWNTSKENPMHHLFFVDSYSIFSNKELKSSSILYILRFGILSMEYNAFFIILVVKR
jgi:hypothetical protein